MVPSPVEHLSRSAEVPPSLHLCCCPWQRGMSSRAFLFVAHSSRDTFQCHLALCPMERLSISLFFVPVFLSSLRPRCPRFSRGNASRRRPLPPLGNPVCPSSHLRCVNKILVGYFVLLLCRVLTLRCAYTFPLCLFSFPSSLV